MKQNRRLNIVIDYEIKCNDEDVPYVEANINEAVKTFVKEALVEDLNKSVDTKSVWLNGVVKNDKVYVGEVETVATVTEVVK